MLAEPPTVKNLKPVQLTSADQAYMDMIFISEKVFDRLLPISGLPRDSKFIYVKLKGYTFAAGKANIGDMDIAIGKIHRGFLRIGLTDLCDITLWVRPADREVRLSQLQLELEGKVFVSTKKVEIDEAELGKSFRKICKDHVYQPGQVVLLDYFGNVFEGRVVRTQLMDIGVEKAKSEPNVPGVLVEETDIEFSCGHNDKFALKSTGNKVQNIFQPDFDFDKLGVGGLNREIGDIFRRAFASRRFPPSVLKKYGIRHVKGVLLYGPPGTGKTLMARQLSKALRSKEPKIINGPELFDKYVGETEKKIRELFAEAINDQRQYGEESQLHILIFDEFDSICRQRGSISSGTGVHDSAVNQLLAMMDGVEALNNILLIGMTNRKDMLDEAVLRPGRFEVHIEVGLPDEKGRLQILNIHTKQMQANKLLHADVKFEELAKKMKNYTGAEIEAVVKSASSFAFNRGNDVANFSKQVTAINEECKVEMQDFELALDEVRPQFGADLDRFEMYLRGGMIDYGARLKRNQEMLRTVMNQLRSSKNQQLVSLLLEGEVGAGKTALASWGATTSDFPYIKVISADNMLGLSDVGKINAMVKIFEDAYRTELAVIVLDDIERLIEFVDIGSRFSNPLLQTLLVLIKRIPPKITNKLVVIGTTSSLETMKEVGVAQSFNFTIHVPTLKNTEHEIKNVLLQNQCNPKDAQAIAEAVPMITIKKLLLVLEMTGHKGHEITYERFIKSYHDYIS